LIRLEPMPVLHTQAPAHTKKLNSLSHLNRTATERITRINIPKRYSSKISSVAAPLLRWKLSRIASNCFRPTPRTASKPTVADKTRLPHREVGPSRLRAILVEDASAASSVALQYYTYRITLLYYIVELRYGIPTSALAKR
jgi:hypothetical protein